MPHRMVHTGENALLVILAVVFITVNKHGNWIKDTNTCRAQAGRCLGKTINNCVVPSTYFLGGMGVCAPGYTGSCAYHCGIKGDWIKDHNSCHVHVE